MFGMSGFFTTIWEYIVGFITTLRPNDLVDILIVAFIIYKVIQLVQETRAAQLVKGIALLVFAYYIASIFKLHSLRFLLDLFVQYVVLALIVVFQPELRRALEQIGRSRIGRFALRSKEGEDESRTAFEEVVSSVCKAAVHMSESKTGALIVFERETKLGDVIKTGTIVNADVRDDIIGNIFFPNAPLHDGAMIIRDNRIYAAGCFLPLSQNQQISRELGTRHRAALGVSENSDAFAVIVSEETGAISLAVNGTLKRNLSGEELKKIIIEGYAPLKTIEIKGIFSGFRRWKKQ